MQLKLRKHPNAYIAIKWNLNLLVITFLTTLMPLARVVLRNDASPSDGDNKMLVCVRGDQCHDHIKDFGKEWTNATTRTTLALPRVKSDITCFNPL